MNQNDIEKAVEHLKRLKNDFPAKNHPILYSNHCERIDLAISALQAQAERRWIPVSEKMPDNCGMPLLLVGVNGYGQRRVFQGFTGYMKRETLLFFSNTRDVDINAWDITHWMPLPEPPKE